MAQTTASLPYVTRTGPIVMRNVFHPLPPVQLYVIAVESPLGRTYFDGLDWTRTRANARTYLVCSSAVADACRLSAIVPEARLTVWLGDRQMRAVQAGAVAQETPTELTARLWHENNGDTPPGC